MNTFCIGILEMIGERPVEQTIEMSMLRVSLRHHTINENNIERTKKNDEVGACEEQEKKNSRNEHHMVRKEKKCRTFGIKLINEIRNKRESSVK